MIRLFPETATEFTTNGIGYLPDATECAVTEQRNGIFELKMKYPITGRHYHDLSLRSIIVAPPNPYDNPQPFRIYEITKPMKKLVTIYAEHISYDMSGYPVSPFEASNAVTALESLKSHSAVTCPFTFWTDKSTSATMKTDRPYAMRALLGGQEGSILDVYGGEYKFDGYLVRLYGDRGDNRGVSIRYGKNLTDVQQEENCAAVYTGVYPYWISEAEDGSTVLVTAEPKMIEAPGTFNFQRIMMLDCTSDFQEQPTPEQLKTRAENYISTNDVGVPKVSIDVSFVDLMSSPEYETLQLLETVHLCDTVSVEFEELGVKATSKCVKTEYNVLNGTYNSITLGESRGSIASTIVTASKETKSEFEKTIEREKYLNNRIIALRTEQQQAIDHATKLITGNLGGNVILHSSTGGDTPDEILVMDTTDIATAKKIWRWNLAGLGYSNKGYNGPYELAMTMDGVFVADFIQTGTMSANRIKGGILVLGNENNKSGTLQIYDDTGRLITNWDVYGTYLTIGNRITDKDISPYSFTVGQDNCASEKWSVAIGHGVRSYYQHQISLGKFNDPGVLADENPNTPQWMFTLGNGSDNTHRRNAMVVTKEGHLGVGLIYLYNIVNTGIVSGMEPVGLIRPSNNSVSLEFGSNVLIVQKGSITGSCEYNAAGNGTTMDMGSSMRPWNKIWAAYTSIQASDMRLKQNINTLDPKESQNLILNLNPVKYQFINNEHGRYHWGFIAQEVGEVLEKVGIDSNDFSGYVVDNDKYFLSYAEFIAPMVSTIQTQQSKIDKLESQVANLQSQINELRGLITNGK